MKNLLKFKEKLRKKTKKARPLMKNFSTHNKKDSRGKSRSYKRTLKILSSPRLM